MITSGVEQPEWALLTFAINHIFIFLARRLFEGRGRGRVLVQVARCSGGAGARARARARAGAGALEGGGVRGVVGSGAPRRSWPVGVEEGRNGGHAALRKPAYR